MTTIAMQLSPPGAPATEPLVDRLAWWASTRPEAPAYTFVDFVADPAGLPRGLTWARLHRWAAGLAGRLRQVAGPGDRVAVLAPSGVEYVVALFAAWYARTVAVPLFAPQLPGHADRLAASYEDCAPACVVTVPATAAVVGDFVAARRHRVPVLLAVEDVDAVDPCWPGEPVGWDDVAYLQYSSGSTRVPAGVEITHRNLTANVAQMCAALVRGRDRFTGVNWLPLFHDMGLLATVAVPLWAGTDSVLLDPTAFLMRPERWLRLLSGRPAAYTAAPNFAYDYCLRRLARADLEGLDLRGVFAWLNGAEPVRAGTIERFVERFGSAGTGLDERAVCPAYGLAEATVFVAAGEVDRPPAMVRFDAELLATGRAVPARDGVPASTLVSCGRPTDQHVLIVDPERRVALPAGQVGEIWVHGPNVSRRYWRRPEASALLLGAELAEPPPDGLPVGPWLRTGDLGALHDGELFVTGRLKDLLIVAGRNHYPQDIEETIAGVSPVLGRAAAFAVPAEEQNLVVVVAEMSRSDRSPAARSTELARLARGAVWQRHDIALHDVVLTRPGAIPRTTSGKVSRIACRERYLAGGFRSAGGEAPGA